ncbi:hypothetical protein CN995_10140 [Bacillus cereus]|nr:hypothetical protein CN289_20760 [Bacillus cereus]PFK65231.1 hypothetical protein COJ25_25965 [Bacillus cereus]PGP05890.1 hypothetical protein CN995_10140 [Bacillus cereus]
MYKISMMKNPAYNTVIEARNLDRNTTEVPQNLIGEDNMNEQMMELLEMINENLQKMNGNMEKLVANGEQPTDELEVESKE